MKDRLTRSQNSIWIACFISYTAAYVARLNLSAALSRLMGDLSLTDAQGGMFQTVFALVYAAGQLVNGALVDRISPRRHIALGLIASGVCNALFTVVGDYRLMVVVWALNGAAQSMLWTPIVRLMAVWFKGQRRTRVSFGMSMTLVLGNVSAWALSGLLAAHVGWRLSFMIPAALVICVSFLAFALLRDEPAPGEDLGEDQVRRPAASEHGSMPLGSLFLKTGLIAMLLCCVGNGFVRDGIITWGPTILANLNGGQGLGSTLSSLLIPALNLIGILFARRLYALFGGNARRCAGILMAVSGLLALALHGAALSVVSCALVLGLCCAATYGINPMLTQLIPMEYEGAGRVGLVAGLCDCFIYLGSSLAGVVTGAMSDAAGWPVVFVLWSLVAAVSMAFAFLSLRGGIRLRSAAD